ncbi:MULTISPECIES: transglycosylase domain-containing protein [unclassified Nocardioides]|uniref:transglycosylase domain-containing protein n=1 Tax=unclassified Nocardioides TaxID=2615069 RepID=UPI003015156D
MPSSPLPPSSPPPTSGGDRLTAGRVVSHVVVMLAVSAVLGVIVAGLAIPFAGVAGVGARNASEALADLPEELDTGVLPQRTQILDSQDNVMATIYDQNRVEVSLGQISRTMVKAIVAIEDYRFYEHGALDLKGTLRAFVTNAANDGATVQGGSSITQQLVKQTLVTQANTDEERREATATDYSRKIRELRYAIAMEEEHSKDWILERYLNIAYFGDGAYGIQAAAKHYFNVNARKLDLRQSAMLAGLVQSPDALDPTDNEDRALARRNVVLDRMAQLNVIPQERADRVKERSLGLRVQPANNGCTSASAPFFCDYVLKYLMRDKSLGRTRADREQILKSGGLTIRTTLDQRFQDAADKAVTDTVSSPKANAIGGLAMVEPGTGEVRAIAQSRPMGRNKKAGQTFINYAVNEKYGTAKGFQGGSTFKAFVLAQAIEDGIPLSEAINSPSPGTFQEEDYEDCDGEPYGYGEFQVPNSTTGSIVANMYNGTRLSVNTFFLGLEKMTGICEPYNLAKKMGLDLTNPTGDKRGNGAERVPNFTLGVADVSPLEMAEAYATFAARGKHCDTRPVTSIEDSKGNVLKEYKPTCTRVMQESTADAVSDVLRGLLEGSGFAAAQNLGRDAGGKTGTTNNGNSVWFAGYTPTMAAAAMIAGANQEGSPSSLNGVDIGSQTIYGAVSGSRLAAPIWGSAMRATLDLYENKDFVYPSGVAGAGVTAPAPQPTKGGRGGRDNDNDGRGGRGNGGRGNGGGRGGR